MVLPSKNTRKTYEHFKLRSFIRRLLVEVSLEKKFRTVGLISLKMNMISFRTWTSIWNILWKLYWWRNYWESLVDNQCRVFNGIISELWRIPINPIQSSLFCMNCFYLRCFNFILRLKMWMIKMLFWMQLIV